MASIRNQITLHVAPKTDGASMLPIITTPEPAMPLMMAESTMKRSSIVFLKTIRSQVRLPQLNGDKNEIKHYQKQSCYLSYQSGIFKL